MLNNLLALGHDKAQNIIDQITAAYENGGPPSGFGAGGPPPFFGGMGVAGGPRKHNKSIQVVC